MIGYIKGTIEERTSDAVILEQGGIGYLIYMPMREMEGGCAGSEVKIYTYLHVKEDLLQLYGFLRREELELFKLLIGVNGVGPKAALAILSSLSGEALHFAILSEDVSAIQKAPGIGKKTAQKVILELKDKLSASDAYMSEEAGGAGTVPNAGSASEEAVSALTALGYTAAQAMQAVRKAACGEDMSTEAILKAALKFIF